jgi:AcrR family transcriptional regulator
MEPVLMRSSNSSKSERILESAVHLFAQQGYHATSTREIARRAEVSENTLFRYFTRKEDLFWSALRSRTAIIAQWDLFDDGRDSRSPQVILPKILEVLTETVNNRSETLRLIAIAYLELKTNAEAHCKDLLAPFLLEISQYFAKSVAKGEVLEVDPSLLTASLMAMVLIHPQFAKLTAGSFEPSIDSRGAANAYSKFWLDILIPRTPATIRSY